MKKKPAKPQAAAKPGAARKPAPWQPVPVAVQRRQHAAAVAAARKPWQPVPVGVQVRQHQAAVRAAPAARKKPVKRKLALGEAVACCAAEALAASLRLAGWPVSDAEVVNLYRLTADGDDEGATIEATLEAAASRGLAGRFPVTYSAKPGPPTVRKAAGLTSPGYCQALAVILGADLPGPHAFCDDGAAWWSWGQPYDPADFPAAVIEETWEVTW